MERRSQIIKGGWNGRDLRPVFPTGYPEDQYQPPSREVEPPTFEEMAQEVVNNAREGLKLMRYDEHKGKVIYLDKSQPEEIDLMEAKNRLIEHGYPQE
jgi:hypothetical protein